MDEGLHLLARAFVQVPRRLVGEQQGRRPGQSARQRDALLLAAGELARPVRGAGGESDEL